MSEPALITTIIPVLNRRALLKTAVQSVLAQSYRPIEIIIVDDGSDLEHQAFYSQLESAHPEVSLYRQSNQGPGVARNLGLKYAKGDYIQFLDSDDFLLPQKFSRQVKKLLSNPQACACYGPCVETEQRGLTNDEYASLPAMRLTAKQQSSIFPALLRERWWITSAPLYRRSVFSKVDGYSARRNEEDWEFEARIAALGLPLVFDDAVGSVRLLHDTHLSDGGAFDPAKLRDRCAARESIYDSAKVYEGAGHTPHIQHDDWLVFSKYVFLLARQCAQVNLLAEAKRMVELSIKANDGRLSKAHRVFLVVSRITGMRIAAVLVRWLGR